MSSRSRRTRRLAFLLIMTGTAVSFMAAAQTRKPRPTTTKKVPAKPLPSTDDDGGIAPLATKEGAEPVVAQRDGGKSAVILDQRTTDGGTRVFRFGEVEIEGRLKSPQIVYFLRRVRAEFAAGELGHRSFMRELGETKNEPGF